MAFPRAKLFLARLLWAAVAVVERKPYRSPLPSSTMVGLDAGSAVQACSGRLGSAAAEGHPPTRDQLRRRP